MAAENARHPVSLRARRPARWEIRAARISRDVETLAPFGMVFRERLECAKKDAWADLLAHSFYAQRCIRKAAMRRKASCCARFGKEN